MLGKTLTAEQQQVSDIFKRLREAYGVNKNAALERHLSLSNSFCTNTINRGSIPYQLIHQTCLATNFSFDYLLNGTDDLNLIAIENGLLKSLSILAGSGFIKSDSNNTDALRKIAKIQCEYVEKEFAIQKDNN